jgi:hypothetical protein
LPGVKDVYIDSRAGSCRVVLPAFAIAGYHGAQATIIVLAGDRRRADLARGVMPAGTRSRAAAWFAWAAAVSSLDLLIQKRDGVSRRRRNGGGGGRRVAGVPV